MVDLNILNRMIADAACPETAEASVAYITEHLQKNVKRGDRVLICFSPQTVGGLGWLMEQATLRCGGVPVIWGPDYRWKSLLQQAFYSHASVIIAPPLIVLGLCKLKKYTGLPLYIRHAVMAGYPCLDWMIEGIRSGLDCTCSGCFGFGETGIIAGFSCGIGAGVHLRQDAYEVALLDSQGNPVAEGEVGNVRIFRKGDPQCNIPLGDQARILTEPCGCGWRGKRLGDFFPNPEGVSDLAELGQRLHSWTSVLDCRLKRSEYGLELEMIVFPGEKLPKLPTAAKQIIRPWDPKHDTPFHYAPTVKKWDFPGESH